MEVLLEEKEEAFLCHRFPLNFPCTTTYASSIMRSTSWKLRLRRHPRRRRDVGGSKERKKKWKKNGKFDLWRVWLHLYFPNLSSTIDCSGEEKKRERQRAGIGGLVSHRIQAIIPRLSTQTSHRALNATKKTERIKSTRWWSRHFPLTFSLCFPLSLSPPILHADSILFSAG